MTVITDKKAFEKAVPILATDTKRLPKLLAALTPAERRWADDAGIRRRAAQHVRDRRRQGQCRARARGRA